MIFDPWADRSVMGVLRAMRSRGAGVLDQVTAGVLETDGTFEHHPDGVSR